MSTKIRFLVYNAYGIGGTVKTVFNFADYLQNTGKYDVEIMSVRRTKETPVLCLNPKVKLKFIQDARRKAVYTDEEKSQLSEPSILINQDEDLYRFFNAYTDKKIREYLGSLHDGALITTNPSFNMLAATLVDDRVLKIGQEHKSFSDHTPGIQKMIRDNYGNLDALTILTEKNRHIYERKIHEELSICVLGNGTERLPYRANLKNHIIVAAGRYAQQKGYDLLIESFALIADEFSDWILKIYGEGTLTKDYINLIHKYNLEKRIVLEPGSDQMNEKLSEASLHVCSSYYEPFGMVIIEGFAMGLPCVAFACDGPREIITDGYDGIIVPKEDVAALAEAMKKVMADEGFRRMLGDNAYETSKKYDINVIGENLRKLIESGLKKKAKDNKIKNMAMESEIENDANPIITEKIDDVIDDNTYTGMIGAASEGRVGFATIWKMFKGWLKYKFKKKVVN